MKLVEAIARSLGNKAQAHNTSGQLVIVQERYDAKCRWWHVWLLMGDGNVSEIDSNPGSEKMKYFDMDWQSNQWSPVEDAIDSEELLSAIQTAAYELGKDNGEIAKSEHLLREEAQKTLNHLQSVLRRYHREIR